MRKLCVCAAVGGVAVAVAAATAQDTCASALIINLNDEVTGTTVGASGSLPNNAIDCAAGDVGQNAEDHWYVFTPALTGSYTVETCGSGFDTSLAIYEGGCPPGVEFFFACNDDGCHTQSRLNEILTGGTAYYIRVAGWNGNAGPYTLRVFPSPTAPANDNCASATPIGFNTTVIGRTHAATLDGFASCPIDGSSRDAWHSFSPPATGQYVVSLCGAEFDTTLTVYESPCYTGVEVGCNDDAGCGFAGRVSQVSVMLTEGTMYLIRIASWQLTEAGQYAVHVSSGEPPPANDDCANAVAIASMPFTHSVNTIFASPDGPPGSCNAFETLELENSVWYTYTPLTSQTVELLVNATNDQLVNVYSGPDCGNLTEVRCHDEDDVPVNYFVDLLGGTKYWFGVGEWGAEGGGATDVLIRAIEIGACCTASGCAVMTDVDCAAAGGAFQGDGSSCATGSAASFTRTTQIGEVLIGPDAGMVSTDSQTIAGAPASIGEVEVTIDLVHPFPDELHIDLIHVASGTTVRLWEESCLLAATDMLVTYDDEAGPLTCVNPLLNVTARPVAPLSAFNGLNANGEWRVRFEDVINNDGGELVGWTIAFTAADPNACPAICACEFDGGMGVDVFDLLSYLDLWFVNAAGADIDGAAGVDVFDLLFFLDCWFPASAGGAC